MFELATGNAVCGFEAFIKNKHIIGKVEEKKKAHAKYKQAVESGKRAYLIYFNILSSTSLFLLFPFYYFIDICWMKVRKRLMCLLSQLVTYPHNVTSLLKSRITLNKKRTNESKERNEKGEKRIDVHVLLQE